ncbi:MAG: MFS transporter, partial [Pseudomonadota bacterium]
MTTLTIGLIAMLAAHAFVTMATLAAPALSPVLASALNVDALVVGYYTSTLLAASFFAASAAPAAIDRYGGVRVTQASLVIGAASLVCLSGGALWLAALSALLGGIAFGPCTPASSTVLA